MQTLFLSIAGVPPVCWAAGSRLPARSALLSLRLRGVHWTPAPQTRPGCSPGPRHLCNSRNRSLRRRAAGVSSRNRSLRSLCTRKEALLAAIGVPEMIVTHGIYPDTSLSSRTCQQSKDRELRMFGMSAERNGVERPARIDSGGTPPLRSLCTRKETYNPRSEQK